MLERIAATMGAGADVARAETELARQQAWRAGLGVAAIIACAGVAGASVLALAAAGVLTLAPATGLAGALAIVGGTLLLASAGGVRAVLARFGHATGHDLDEARRRAEAARRLLHAKATQGRKEGPPSSPAAGAVRAAASHPEVVASAAFAASTILGARRTLRVARLLAGAAGTAGSSSLLAGMLSRATSTGNGTADRGTRD